MKVRFSSPKEHSPNHDNGLQVLYGPGRRVAYRLRWYLILALVSAPLVWVCSRLLIDAVLVEAPAQLSLSSLEVRALDTGIVEELPVRVGSRVKKGQLLLRLQNPEWNLRLQQLSPIRATGKDPLGQASRALQTNAVELQQRTVNLYRKLQRSGGLTSAELLQAEAQLNGQRLAELELGRRLHQEQYQWHGAPIDQVRAERERQWLTARLKLLTYTAQKSGRIAEVNVQQGENVGPGSLLMRIEQAEPPTLWIYLQPQAGQNAKPGRRVDVLMPNGSWRAARILEQADLARRPPSGLPGAWAAEGLALRIPARFLEPLPAMWRVDQLPLKVRFPQPWLSVLTPGDG